MCLGRAKITHGATTPCLERVWVTQRGASSDSHPAASSRLSLSSVGSVVFLPTELELANNVHMDETSMQKKANNALNLLVFSLFPQESRKLMSSSHLAALQNALNCTSLAATEQARTQSRTTFCWGRGSTASTVSHAPTDACALLYVQVQFMYTYCCL